MDRKQKLFLALFIVGTVIGVFIIVVSGGVLQPARTRPFRAAPGTQRDAARPLFSDTVPHSDPPDEDLQTGPPPEADFPPAPDDVLAPSLPPGPAPEALSPVDQVILHARLSYEPRTGVERIEELLRSLKNIAEAARLYTAKADLLLAMDPPDIARADAAVAEALEYAEGASERDEARCVQVEILRRTDRGDEALELAEQIASGEGPDTAGKFSAGLMHAAMHRERGDIDAAEQAYRDLMRRAARAGDSLGARAEDVYRQAGLNLVHMLREAGKREQANAAAKEIEEQLQAFRGPGGP